MGVPPATAPPASEVEVVSPELVLVDQSLRLAWQRRVEAVRDTPAPRPAERAEEPFIVDPGAARRLVHHAAAAETVEGVRHDRPTRLYRLAATVVAVSAAGMSLLLLAEGRVGSEVSLAPTVPATPAVPLAQTTPKVPATPAVPSAQTTPKARTARVASPPPTAPRDSSSRALGPRRFAWAPVQGATGYHVELFRGSARVFAAERKRPEVVIPAKWTFEGREHRLEALEYVWYVWPIVSGRRASEAVVQARLVIRDS